MPTPDEAWDSVFAALDRLRERWPSSDWTYDRRLKCVASSIPLSGEAAARAAFADVLPGVWSSATLPGAPAAIRTFSETCGGVRASQELLWGGEADGPGAFGLWWPWGDGTTVTLRIGLHGVDLPKQRYPRLRDLFGIPQATAPG